MASTIAAEKRMLTATEFDAVARSRYPAIAELPREELIEIAKRIRTFRDKARDMIRHRRREHRGKAEQRGANPAPSEAGISRKRQVFASALKRLNNELRRLEQTGRSPDQAKYARQALEMKRAHRVRHHPSAGRTAGQGMQAIPSDRDTVEPDPREIGRVSQFVKNAQARRDG